jgi:uncharacterized membrane protein
MTMTAKQRKVHNRNHPGSGQAIIYPGCEGAQLAQRPLHLSINRCKPTRALAANQGLYNGFLAAGLFWSLVIDDPLWSGNVAVFFLSCVAVAGIYGSITADKKIFWIQGLLPLLALGVYFLAQ